MTPPPHNNDTTRSDLGARPPELDEALAADKARRAAATDEPATASDPARVRRLVLLDLVGRGGFGEVYAARLETPGGLTRRVAVKLLREDVVDDQTIARTIDEAHLLARLSHPTVVAIEDLVNVHDRLAIISEYVDGVDVSDVLPLPPLVALQVFGRVAEALHAAWSSAGPDGQPLRIVHRDIKPSNIRVGPNGVVKLLDFGIARSESGPRRVQTGSGLLVGSIGYVAPERWLGHREEHAADLYALGCVLVEALTGDGVFRGVAPVRQMAIASDPAVHTDWVEQQLQGLATIAPQVAPIARQLLAWNPEQRPSAMQFVRLARRAAAELDGDGLLAWSGTLEIPSPGDWSTADGTVLSETEQGFNVVGNPITAELQTLQRARSVGGGVDSLTTRLMPDGGGAEPVRAAAANSPDPSEPDTRWVRSTPVAPASSAPSGAATQSAPSAALAQPPPTAAPDRGSSSRSGARLMLWGGGAFTAILLLGVVGVSAVGGVGLWGWSSGWWQTSSGVAVDDLEAATGVERGPEPTAASSATSKTEPAVDPPNDAVIAGPAGALAGSEPRPSQTKVAPREPMANTDEPGTGTASSVPTRSQTAGTPKAPVPSGSSSSAGPATKAGSSGPDPEPDAPAVSDAKPVSTPPSTRSTAASSPPAPTATGLVRVEGRAQVRLSGAAGFVPVGQVTPGTYKVQAAFSDAVFRDFGTLTVKADGRYTIACLPRFRRCEVK